MEIENLFDFDEDLFEDQCDQELEVEPQSENQDYNLFSFCFECSGSSDDQLADSDSIGVLKMIMSQHSSSIPDKSTLFNHIFDNEDLPIDILIRMAGVSIQKLASSMVDSSGNNINQLFLSTRQSVTRLLLILRFDCDEVSNEQLQLLRVAMGTFDSMPGFASLYSTCSSEGTSSNSSSYHLLHGLLEWRWIYLSIIYNCERSKGTLTTEESEFKTELTLLMYDLVALSISKFNKNRSTTIIATSPFICSCTTTMWTSIYYLIEESHNSSLNFWSIITTILQDLRSSKNICESFPSKKILLRSSGQVMCKDLDQYSVWLVCGLVKLSTPEATFCDQDSLKLFENLIKNSLNTELSEENLRALLVIIHEVILGVSSTKSDVLLLLWETFQRKINSPFYIAGQNLKSMAVSSSSAEGYLEKIKSQLTVAKLNTNLSSYDMFVYFLGRTMQNFTQEGQKNQVQKILGRIYSKFPVAKLQTLNEIGIHNLLVLLITVSISTNFPDVAKKVSDMLLQIPMEKINYQQQLMKGHVAMLILHKENFMNLGSYASKLINQVNHLTDHHNSNVNPVLKVLAEALLPLTLKGSEDECFELGEDIIFDTWIVRYLSSASMPEQDRVYETFSEIIQKLRDVQAKQLGSSTHISAVKKLFSILLPHCKQVFGKNESVWSSLLSARLCLLSSDYQQLTGDIPKFDVIFRSFIEINCSNVESGVKFLTAIMENNPKIRSLDSHLIIQNWIKFSVLLSGSNQSLKELIKCISKLDDFAVLSESARTQPEQFIETKEPLCSFIIDVGNKFKTSSNQVKLQIIEKVHGYFSSFEKWALPYIKQLQHSAVSQKSPQPNNDECVMRIYTFIAITILHCSELIYVRSKPTCFFNVAMSQFILTPAVIMGHQQSKSTSVSMYKVWPLIIEGITKLDYKNDQHVAKVLNDVIVKWTPHLKISGNPKVVMKPFLNVASKSDSEIVELVFGALGKNFIALQNRKPSPHASLVLTVIEEIMHAIEGSETKVIAIWKNLMTHVVEAAIMSDENCSSQSVCYNLLERFIKNKNFESSQHLKELLVSCIRTSIQNHLSYHSPNCFRFMTKITKFSPKLASTLMAFMMEQIKRCEQLRGSGADVKLRTLYDQLTKSLGKQSKAEL